MEITWICPSCGTSNHSDETCHCGEDRPDYKRHAQVLGGDLAVNNGSVFNASVIHVHNHPVEDVEEEEEEEEDNWDFKEEPEFGPITHFFILFGFWSGIVGTGIMMCVFGYLFWSGIFGVL